MFMYFFLDESIVHEFSLLTQVDCYELHITSHVLEIEKKRRLIAIYRNDNRALKRDKSPIFDDIFSDYYDKSRFINDYSIR